MKKLDFENAEACVDCVMYIANGDVPDEQFLEEFDNTVLWYNGWAGEDTEDEDYEDTNDLGFTWRQCECCGSTLGGNRYKVCYQEVVR